MNIRRFLIEGTTLIISAIILGLVANAMAASDRKVSLAAPEMGARQQVGQPAGAAGEPTSSIIEDDARTSNEMTGQPTFDEELPPAAPAQQASEQAAPQGAPQTASKASRSEILERFPPNPDVPAEEIHTDDAEWLWKNGALFLDARRTSVYNDGHIPGARNFAVWEADIDEKVKAMSTQGLDGDMPIVIYCSGGECEDSHMLAQKLWGMFFNNIRVYHEGYPGWTAAGNPVNRGPQP